MQTIFAWILIGVMIAAAYPLTSWLLAKSSRHNGAWLTAITTLAISIGTLTLIMFWEGLLGLTFTIWGIVLPYLGLMLVGGWLWWKSPHVLPKISFTINTASIKANWPHYSSLFAVGLIAAAVLFNAAYWPFHHDDVLGIYGKYGKLMYETRTLVPFAGRDDAFYQAYPIQVPLAYAFTFLASGWENEYLARVMPALLSLGCLPAVFVLGRMIANYRAGALAALLLALTPSFVRWASSGYVDLPMAFFYTMGAIFAWRLYDAQANVDALLLGILIGLAAWTKNAALLGIPLVVLSMIYVHMSTKRITRQHFLITITACLLIAAPWYIRNWFEARLIVPPTAWTDQAQRTLTKVLVFITKPENFALTGWLIMIGVVAALYQIIRQRQGTAGQMLLLTLTVPFFAAWWLLVSYDPRFLLLFLPLLTVTAGIWITNVWDHIPDRWRTTARLVTALAVIILTIYMIWISVEFKREILHNPLMSDDAKHNIVLH
jgi:Dolichyl-phosphate-mannose-protein mannosyltransferase